MTRVSPDPSTENLTAPDPAPAAGVGVPETAALLATRPARPAAKVTFLSQLRASLAMFSNPKSASGLIIMVQGPGGMAFPSASSTLPILATSPASSACIRLASPRNVATSRVAGWR